MQSFFNKIKPSVDKNKEKEVFDIDTYNNLIDECTTKERKLNIIKLKQIASYYDKYFPDKLDSNYLNKNNIELRDYLIKFFCINKKNIFILYNKINNIKAVNLKKKSDKKFDYSELESIISACKTKKWTTNLDILKKVAIYYDDIYPNELDHNYLDNDNLTIKAYLSNFFCKNPKKVIEIYNLINNDNVMYLNEDDSKKKSKVTKQLATDDNQVQVIDIKAIPDAKNKKKQDVKVPIKDIKIQKDNIEDEIVEDEVKDNKKKKKDIKDIKEIKINLKKIEPAYLNDFKKEYKDLDNKDFTIKKFEDDIKKDDFIMNLIESQKTVLEYKLLNYQRLLNQNLNDILQVKIKEFIEIITEELVSLNSDNVDIINIKRKELLALINNQNYGFNSIKGTSRDTIKIGFIKLIYIFYKNPIIFLKSFNNFIITGQQGSGKVNIIKVLTYIFNILGINLSSNIIYANKGHLIDIENTRNLIEQGLEGVVFIDDIHNISNCKKDVDSNVDDVINELISNIDKYMGCLIIIITGNKDKIQECFFKLNDSLNFRFPRHYDLSSYTSDDIYELFENYINDIFNYNDELKLEQRKFIKEMIISLNNKNAFTFQSIDMITLSNLIAEDFSLYSTYNTKEIKLTFKKFMLNKNLMIEFL
jgi:hypothetical protein